MCSRFALMQLGKILTEQFEIDDIQSEPHISYNIPPTSNISIVTPGSRILESAEWGFVPSWSHERSGSPQINARSETAFEKPTFKEAFFQNRCLIPASGFYEWKTLAGKKVPHYFSLKDSNLFAFAGLYSRWIDKENTEHTSCTILTREPNSLVKPIHNRMPVIMKKENYESWLHSKSTNEKELLKLLPEIKSEEMQVWEVSSKMSNSRYKEEDAVKPVKDSQSTLI